MSLQNRIAKLEQLIRPTADRCPACLRPLLYVTTETDPAGIVTKCPCGAPVTPIKPIKSYADVFDEPQIVKTIRGVSMSEI